MESREFARSDLKFRRDLFPSYQSAHLSLALGSDGRLSRRPINVIRLLARARSLSPGIINISLGEGAAVRREERRKGGAREEDARERYRRAQLALLTVTDFKTPLSKEVRSTSRNH